MKEKINLLREFSVPLISGVIVALFWANYANESYHHFLHATLLGPISVHFLTNDVFMVFFFGIAAVEITQAFLPGGDLNPPLKAANPLIATLGGVVGPVIVYFTMNHFIGSPRLISGWGIPTATDIAIAWLVGRTVFGNNHPAVSFLLLLAIVDDAIGLAIIAIFYTDPLAPVRPAWLLLIGLGMGIAFLLRKKNIRNYWPYVLFGGGASWLGFFNSHLHPALALVVIIPFMPHAAQESKHIFEENPQDYSTLAGFEHEWKVIVDFGLFMFGLVNAGVQFSSLGIGTWLVFNSLLFGKALGIFLFGYLALKAGFRLPDGMSMKELVLTGLIAGIGFTVSLFIAGEAFVSETLQDQAKMGAMFSIFIAFIAIVAGKVSGVQKIN